MAEPFAGPGGMAMGINSRPPRQPLCGGLVEGAYKGICLIM